MSTKKDYYFIDLSKNLSYILRHGAVKQNIDVAADGYVLLDDLMILPKFFKYSLDDIKHVVDTNDKQRFGLKQENDKWYIRANQGHSQEVAAKIDQDELLTKLTKPLELIVHGTTFHAYKAIKESGLKKMDRSHIHFSITDEIIEFAESNTRQSGIRSNCQLMIYINMKQAMEDGIEFYMSENKVVLTPGVGEEGLLDKKYFQKVINRKNGQRID